MMKKLTIFLAIILWSGSSLLPIPSAMNNCYAAEKGFQPSQSDSTGDAASSLSDTGDIPIQPNKITWYSMITEFPGDMYQFAKNEVKSPNLLLYGTITALTTALLITDDKTWDASHRWYEGNNTVYNVSNFFTEVGDGRTQFGLAAAFGLYGAAAGDSKALTTASQIVEAVLSSGAVVQVFKHITGRESPFVSTRPRGTWRWFPNQIDYHKHVPSYDAYPSGHICTSVAAFVVIADNYPDQKWLTPLFGLTTAAIGIGMVNRGIHWYSDYPLGIAIGYTFGKMIVKKYDTGNESKSYSSKLSFYPFSDGGSDGVSITYAF